MASKELILQAIESAKCRIYKLNFDLNGELSAHHQKKAENQKELMEVTVEALEKQIPKKPLVKLKELIIQGYSSTNEYFHCPCCDKVFGFIKYVNYEDNAKRIKTKCCPDCGQKLDWSESDGQLEDNN